MKKLIVALVIVLALTLATAVPVFAFNHANIPPDECSDNANAAQNGTAAAGAIGTNPAVDEAPVSPATAPTPDACA